jgi:hypothetical protein
MSDNNIEYIKSLYFAAINACADYTDGLPAAECRSLSPLFRDMIVIHTGNAIELKQFARNAACLCDGKLSSGEHCDRSFDIAALFGGLDDRVVPGLIAREQDNIRNYDQILNQYNLSSGLRELLQTQRDRLSKRMALFA